jgi:hypothetical protein
MKRLFALLLITVSVGLASGCSGMPKSWSEANPWGEKKPQISESKYQVPTKMAVLWTPAMYNGAGKKPTRGFGGRMYFYNAKNETIPVQGQLVVYCFNDSDKTNDHKQADRRVAFTPEQFSGHFSPTELGASYSIWVPWDAVGNPQVEVSLVPIFTTATGQVVVGSQSLGLLPGPETPIPEKRVEEKVVNPVTTRDGNVTRVGYEEDITAPAFGASRIQSMSITLPQSLAERVAASRNQEPRRLSEPELPPKMLPQTPITPQMETSKGDTGQVPFRESSSGNSEGPMETNPGPLTHSERIQPRAPVMQPPRPTLGPVPMQPPLSGQPSNRPS